MKVIRKYRNCTAAILLMLYAFIATPVQLWHHHHHSKDLQVISAKNIVVSKNANSTSEANCPICQHQYSIYNDDVISIAIQSVIILLSKQEHYNQQTISSFIFAFSNKGPPSFYC